MGVQWYWGVPHSLLGSRGISYSWENHTLHRGMFNDSRVLHDAGFLPTSINGNQALCFATEDDLEHRSILLPTL